LNANYFQVSWPPMTINAPSKVRRHASDVAVTVSFVRSLCATFTVPHHRGKSYDHLAGKNNGILLAAHEGFGEDDGEVLPARLDLVECSRSLVDSAGQDCQWPQPGSAEARRKVWYSTEISDLYRRSSFSVTLDCSVWGRPGTYRLFLVAVNVSHAAVVSRSPQVRVEAAAVTLTSPETRFALPCRPGDVRPLLVDGPRCPAARDRVRLYGQGKPARKWPVNLAVVERFWL
jgi:hypothetical protein